MTSLTPNEILSNTLTGFLVNLVKKKGNMMKFGDIIQFTIDRFDTLRKPTGKPYETKNVRKSIMCALTSNGVFEKITIDKAFL